jgi:subtilisin family serine protease
MSTSTTLQRLALALAIAGITQAAGHAAPAPAGGGDAVEGAKAYVAGAEAPKAIFIVGLAEPPMALYDGSRPGLKSVPRDPATGLMKVDSAEAKAYQKHLETEQAKFLGSAKALLGREIAPLRPEFQFQHAFNGLVLALTDAEAARLATHPAVALVEPYHEYELATDAGPEWIGAPQVWAGQPPLAATRGEGVVVGILDSGANLGSPSFAETDLDGYRHVNPLGTNRFLGWCDPANPNHDPQRDRCNAKLIGGWDFVDFVLDPANPGFVQGAFEARGFEDENGHGSHVAATAAGNRRTATVNGRQVAISGVAPRANIVAYDVCYTNSAGQGLCPNVSTLAAINQTVADGIVRVLNYSISGGGNPWGGANEQAFLAAQNAGVLPVASAGNSGPTAGTVAHLGPWMMTIAASTHDRAGYDFYAGITSPPGAPAAIANFPLSPMTGGAPGSAFTASITQRLVVSPDFNRLAADGNPNDGCTAYPAGTFAGAIALVRRGTCGFADKSEAARAAGAVAVIISNSGVAGNTGPFAGSIAGPPQGQIPTFSLPFTTAQALIAFAQANPSATLGIRFPAERTPGQGDVMAAFSSRGPSPLGSVLKPDVTAPGVAVLAAVSRWNRGVAAPGALNPAANEAVGLLQGTSMSSPHVAGAAALVKAQHPAWTPQEIKSALMTTAVTAGVVKENATTPSDPFDRGAGRVDVARAVRAGFVMNETGARFTAANPATGGDPTQLNLPSFQNLACVGTCTFARSLRSTRNAAVTWTLAVAGFDAGVVTVPATVSLPANGTASFTLGIDATRLPVAETRFGTLTLTPSDASIPVATMPIAVRAQPPTISVAPAALRVNARRGEVSQATLAIRNLGNPSLTWSWNRDGLGNVAWLSQAPNQTSGFSVGFYGGQTPTAGGIYGADDFLPLDSGTLRSIAANGFMTGTGTQTLNQVATGITFSIWQPLLAGIPAGNPEAGNAGLLWSCTRSFTGANAAGLRQLSADWANFELDLAAATGCPARPPLLFGARYWVSVHPILTVAASGRRWAWFGAANPQFEQGMIISPRQINNVPATWTPASTTAAFGFAATVTGDARCGAPWLSLSSSGESLGVGGVSNVNVAIDATSLATGQYRALVCIATGGTDPARPQIVVPVDVQVVR